MATKSDHPAPFTWSVDSDGYERTEDGKRIRRRGGTMASYVPDSIDPPPHHVFKDSFAFGHDVDDWHLEFVRHFGFLGAADRGADSTEELVDWIDTQRLRLTAWQGFSVIGGDGDDDERATVGALDSFNRDIPGHYTIRLERDRVGSPRVGIVPRTLLGWMWLATIREITGESIWIRCAYPPCAKTFQVGPDQKTRRRQYCCDSHRTLHNRMKSATTPKKGK